MERATLAALADEARALVKEHATRAPLDRGLPLETLRAKLAARAGGVAAEEAIRVAAAKRSPNDDGAIAVDADVARVAGAAPLDAQRARARSRSRRRSSRRRGSTAWASTR